MSESIITAESLQAQLNAEEGNEQQDKVDSPDENKDENLETEVSEDDAEKDAEDSEPEETEKTEESEDDDATETDSQTDDTDEAGEEVQEETEKSDKPEIPKWAEKRLQRQQRKHDRELNQLQNKFDQLATTQNAVNYDQATQIQDPFTGNIVDINSVEGQVVLKLQQAVQVQTQVEQQQKTQQDDEDLKRKLEKGYTKFDDFEDVVVNAGITSQGTPGMFEAVRLSDSPEELLYNLGKYKPDEIERISKLSPERQFRETVLLENKLKQLTKKKIVKKVPEPPSKIKGSGQSMKDISDLSFEDTLKLARKAERERLRR